MNDREQRLLYACTQLAHYYLYSSAGDVLDHEFVRVKQNILNALAEYDLVTIEDLRGGRWTQAGLDLLNSKRQTHPSPARSSPPSDFEIKARPKSSSHNISRKIVVDGIFCKVVVEGETTAIGRYNFLSLPRIGEQIAVTPSNGTQETSFRVIRVIHSPFESIRERKEQWVPIQLFVAPS